jgi:hypothetical protein
MKLEIPMLSVMSNILEAPTPVTRGSIGDRLFRLMATKTSFVHADESWVQSVLGSALCPECRCIDRGRFPAPVEVRLRELPAPPPTEGLAFKTGITVVKRTLIDRLGSLIGGFAIGPCRWSDGSLIADYVTMYGPRYIVVRGDRRSQYWVCQRCGSISSQTFECDPYVLRGTLTGEAVYQNARCGIFVSPAAVEGIDWAEFPDVELTNIGIRERAIDGQRLPGDGE